MANNLRIDSAFNGPIGTLTPVGPGRIPTQPPNIGNQLTPAGRNLPGLFVNAQGQLVNAQGQIATDPNAPQTPGLIPPPNVNQLTGGQPLVTVPLTGPVTEQPIPSVFARSDKGGLPSGIDPGLTTAPVQQGIAGQPISGQPITIDGATGQPVPGQLPQAPPTGLIGA